MISCDEPSEPEADDDKWLAPAPVRPASSRRWPTTSGWHLRRPARQQALYLATSGQKEISELTARLAAALAPEASKGLRVTHATMPAETHATIFHPAALTAFRALFAPSP